MPNQQEVTRIQINLGNPRPGLQALAGVAQLVERNALNLVVKV